MTNYKIHDSDRHVIEPLTIWEDYVDSAVFEEYPISLKYDTEAARADRVRRLGDYADIVLPPMYVIGHEASPHGEVASLANWDEAHQIASAHKTTDNIAERIQGTTPEGQLQAMAEQAISSASLFPTFGVFLINHDGLPAHVKHAYVEGYNRWLYDYCEEHPEKLLGVGTISRSDPDFMMKELKQIIHFGWRTITLRPEMISGRTLGHPDYERFWQSCEHYGISVAIHGGTHVHVPTVGTERFTSHFALHACSHSLEIQMAFLSLLESGVLERYPKLKFSFMEAGASWLPHWLWRLDNICYTEFPEIMKNNVTMLPSEYFKRQCWVAIEVEEPCIRQVIDMVGCERILFGTDFPHPDHHHFDISEIAKDSGGLSEHERQLILEENPKNFFGY